MNDHPPAFLRFGVWCRLRDVEADRMKRWPGRWGLYGSEDDEYRYFGAEERLIKGLSKVLSRIWGDPSTTAGGLR